MDLESLVRARSFERKNYARDTIFARSIVLMINQFAHLHAKSSIIKAVVARVLAVYGLAVACCSRIERYAYAAPSTNAKIDSKLHATTTRFPHGLPLSPH